MRIGHRPWVIADFEVFLEQTNWLRRLQIPLSLHEQLLEIIIRRYLLMSRFVILLRSRPVEDWLRVLAVLFVIKIVFEFFEVQAPFLVGLVGEGGALVSLRRPFQGRRIPLLRRVGARLVLLEWLLYLTCIRLGLRIEAKLGIQIHLVILLEHQLREATDALPRLIDFVLFVNHFLQCSFFLFV